MADIQFVQETIDDLIQKMNERLKLVDTLVGKDYITGYKEALSHFNDVFKDETSKWIDEASAASTLSRVMTDIANELGCENDNEAILEAIHDLKTRPPRKDPLAIKKFDEGYRMGYDTGTQVGRIEGLVKLKVTLDALIEEECLNAGG